MYSYFTGILTLLLSCWLFYFSGLQWSFSYWQYTFKSLHLKLILLFARCFFPKSNRNELGSWRAQFTLNNMFFKHINAEWLTVLNGGWIQFTTALKVVLWKSYSKTGRWLWLHFSLHSFSRKHTYLFDHVLFQWESVTCDADLPWFRY